MIVMKRMFFAVCLVLSSNFNPTAWGQSLQNTFISTCNDGGEWPPYFYFVREDGKTTDRLVGYDLDYLNAIFESRNLDFSFELIAWSRCLHEVEVGEKYVMVSSVAYSQERDEKYLMTDSYYTVQPHYFYARSNFPNGLEILTLEEFANYRVCGLRGYNYANFGVPVKDIDTGTKVFPQLIEKTKRGRCDLFLGRFEIFAGFAKTGNDYIKIHDLGTAPMPGVPGDKFYMMVSRNYPQAQELVNVINEGIWELKTTEQDKRLLAPYLQN